MIRMNPTLVALANIYSSIPWDIFVGGTLQIYSGAQPDNPVVATGTLLAQAEHLRWKQRNDNIIESYGWEVDALNNGTAGWYRIMSWDGFYNITGSCGTVGADLNMSNLRFITGQNIHFMNFTLSWAWGFRESGGEKVIKQDVPNEGIYF